MLIKELIVKAKFVSTENEAQEKKYNDIYLLKKYVEKKETNLSDCFDEDANLDTIKKDTNIVGYWFDRYCKAKFDLKQMGEFDQ